MQENKSNNTKKVIFSFIGFLFFIGTIFGGNLKYIFDWSTAELIGYNLMSLISIFGGSYLFYLGIKK